MTFDTWYSANVVPQIEQQIKALPKVVHAQIRKSSREAMAACWNAAIDQFGSQLLAQYEKDQPILGSDIIEMGEKLRVKVTP